MLKQPYTLLVICIMLLQISIQTVIADNFAASAEVFGEDIIFIRDNAQNDLTLSAGSVTAFGINDRVQTGSNGRVLITLSDGNVILLLPNSDYHLTDFSEQGDTRTVTGILNGIAVHQFSADTDRFTYQLQSAQDAFTLSVENNIPQHFAVWSVDAGQKAVTVANGDLDFYIEEATTPITLSDNTGFAISHSQNPVAIDDPLHAARVIEAASPCRGIISTMDDRGLRLRGGAALDYVVVDVRFNGDPVSVTGTTENGLWYRVPFQTGFGWMFSNLIDADCSDLPVYPNLLREDPENIRDISERERAIVQPFYGTPQSNTTFYR